MPDAGVCGLVFTASIGDVVVVDAQVVPVPARLTRAVWLAEPLLLAICLLDLAGVAIRWSAYQVQRADLDTEDAEAVGEVRARSVDARHIHP
ncbi:hypothetical protein ABZ541_23770 [Micromonospora sediminicola]|uniref:hypothetical protein n=1 Tax=Micromonospora sediminicola TaxID=946078 RepID=UPI0033E83B72